RGGRLRLARSSQRSRWSEPFTAYHPGLAADLVGRKVAVIVAGGSVVAVRAAMEGTQTIPIVFTTPVDPVAAGLVASLNRPGGNVTGITTFGIALAQKRLELMHEVIPTAAKVALLVNPNNTMVSQNDIQDVQTAAQRLGLEVIVLKAGSASE